MPNISSKSVPQFWLSKSFQESEFEFEIPVCSISLSLLKNTTSTNYQGSEFPNAKSAEITIQYFLEELLEKKYLSEEPLKELKALWQKEV
ncbi:MAG TPA: hypothetical protein V6C96_00385, partial [Vampirovibrionales bacterium]